MDAVRFTLSGKTAFFKKPDVNTYYYFSYGMIHRVALLGLLGAIAGYHGYEAQKRAAAKAAAQKQEGPVFPEFYDKLKDCRLAIVPHYHSVVKKVQTFNNSVGYASQEQGGNLIVKEQWLEHPAWDIYVALENTEEKKIGEALLENRFAYLPYLGKNDHPADITDVKLVELREESEINRLDCLFEKDHFVICAAGGSAENDEANEPYFKYAEKLPAELSPEVNGYILKDYVFTNGAVKKVSDSNVFRDESLGQDKARFITWI